MLKSLEYKIACHIDVKKQTTFCFIFNKTGGHINMLNELSVLKEAYECGILDATEVAKTIYMTKETYIKQHHSFPIHTRKDGRYITTVRKEDEDRQQISAPTYQELIMKLYDFYHDKKSDYTISDLYELWISKREVQASEKTIDMKTVKRDEQHWRKYYVGNQLITIPIKKITTKMLNDFLDNSIATFSLSKKEFNNMKTILNAVYQIAMDKELLLTKPLLNAHISIKFRSVQKKKDGSKLFLENEMKLLESYLYEQKTIEAYAILLDFQVGTRVGELLALSEEDISDNEVYIHKSEILVEEKANGRYIRKGYDIAEYVKHDISAGYRTLPLTTKAQEILKEVKRLSTGQQYLFTQNNGQRMTSRCFSYWLDKYCKLAGVPSKSSHCIRRTFASRLFAVGMPLTEISIYLGHEDIETTKNYVYNYHEIEENRSFMNKAL